MATSIIVHYLDRDGISTQHSIDTDDRALTYDDLLAEPIAVRTIARHGLVIGRTDGVWLDGYPRVTRSGMYIPPHRIVCIDFADDLKD